MMMEAFKKLPKKKVTVYRGARMSAKIQKVGGKIITYEAFASQSTDLVTAKTYASGVVKTPPQDATTSVLIQSDVESPRYHGDFYFDREAEFLLAPGTKLKVVKIEAARATPGRYPLRHGMEKSVFERSGGLNPRIASITRIAGWQK